MGGGRAFVISMEYGIFNFLAFKQGIKIITTQRRAMDRGEMKPNPFDSLYHLTRPLILEDILTPVAHQVIDRKRVGLNVWTQKKGGISDSAW